MTSSNTPASEASTEVAIYLKEKIHIPLYIVSKNLSVCWSVTMCASSKNGEMGLFRPDLDSVLRLKSSF